jgi:hypothetical protein
MQKLLKSAALLVLAWCAACDRSLTPKRGDELFAIAEDAVLEVTLRSSDLRVDARRFKTDRPLTYTFEARDGRFARCPESPRLHAALAPVFSIRVQDVPGKDAVQKRLAKLPLEAWVELEVHDDMVDGEPYRLRMIRDPEDRSMVLARLSPEGPIVKLDGKLLGLLDQRCDD